MNLWRHRDGRRLMIKRIFGAIWWGVLIVLAILMFSILGAKLKGRVPYIMGHSVMRIVSGSMESEIPEGSYILIKKIDPEEVREGDVITFYSSDYAILGLPNTHRVVEPPIVKDGGYEFVTRGDANSVNDRVTAKGDDLIGVYVRRLDGITRFSTALEGGGMMILMLVLEAFIFVMAAFIFVKAKREGAAESTESIEKEESRSEGEEHI